ncbi:tumor necrosis factor receptor superfamily member 16-like [Rhinatrema bivittatum]|uniref:tumor necrosis factor receptor superfamily member 16-like n=1 Tax=Rhinatrema bivittatum TaxID=194408 RepID=UPI00112BD44A|nr:tumor necrosis factor receptor superfamily member 16-like [Rhinatrema bivittatum]
MLEPAPAHAHTQSQSLGGRESLLFLDRRDSRSPRRIAMENFPVVLFGLLSATWICSSASNETSYIVIQDGNKLFCQFCPPGRRVQKECTKNVNTTCVLCEEDTYLQYPNGLLHCLPCRKPCGDHAREVATCERTQNRVCVCDNDAYELDGLCEQHRKCPLGYGVRKKGTAISNVVCGRCLPGHFSDKISSTDECEKHQNCFLNGYLIKTRGNTTHDTICGAKRRAPTYKPGQHQDLPAQTKSETFTLKTTLSMVTYTGDNGETRNTGDCICLTFEGLLLIIIGLVTLLLCSGFGWCKFIRMKKNMKKYTRVMESVDKDWKFNVKGTGVKHNALHEIAKRIGSDWTKLLGELGYTKDWRTLREEHRTVYSQALEALRLWTQWEENASLDQLKKAVRAIDRNDIYECLDNLVDKQERKKDLIKDTRINMQPIRIRGRTNSKGSRTSQQQADMEKPLLPGNEVPAIQKA